MMGSRSCSIWALRGAVYGLVALAAASASAGDDKKIARAQMERMARMQQAQQALEAEKGQITAEKAEVEGQLKATKAELEKAKAGGRREAVLRKEVDSVQAEKAALSTKLADTEKALQDTRDKLQAALDASAQEHRKLVSTQGTLDQRGQALSRCEGNNLSLYKLNTELLERYEKKSCTSALWSGGALTQLDRVKVENDGSAYRDKLDDLKVQKSPSP